MQRKPSEFFHTYRPWQGESGTWYVLSNLTSYPTRVSQHPDEESARDHARVLNGIRDKERFCYPLTVTPNRSTPKAAVIQKNAVNVSFVIKTLLRAIITIKKLLGISKNRKSYLTNQPNINASKYFEWKRITLEDIDRLWRESGKVDAPFRAQLSHFAHGVETILKNEVPVQNRLNWQTITQDEVDRQWVVSFSVHPAFGPQLGHFAVGIERLVKLRNSSH
jgi:hypothetical protein